ncbi:MAG: DUF2064 domain-containing protein [Actinobacteria bacterium]|nr:DUF2064 domain-containing protein [Actinomycetota bacterium]
MAERVGASVATQTYTDLLRDTILRAASVGGEVALYLALEPDEDGQTPGTGVLPGPAQGGSFARVDSAARKDPAPHNDPAPAGLPPLGEKWRIVAQRGEDLGARLAAVFSDLFAAGHEVVALVGSDSPALPETYLRKALDLLGSPCGREPRPDLVLGPTLDGGYYLIATRADTWRRAGADLTALLGSTPVGTPGVARYTREETAKLGLRLTELPLWFDVDTEEDLRLSAGLSAEVGEAASPVRAIGAVSSLRTIDGDPTAPAAARGGSLDRLREVYLHVTHECDTGCAQCYLRDVRSPGPLAGAGELDTEGWLDLIDQAAALGATGFVIIGGDPFLRSDLLRLIEHITGTHGAKARLFFNRLVDHDLASRLAAAGSGSLVPLLSIDGNEQTNDALRGRGNFADARRSIRALLGAGLRPIVNTVLLKPVLDGLGEMAETIARDGVRTLHLILPHQRGGLARGGDMVPSSDELLTAFLALEKTATQIGLTVDNLSAWKGRLGAPRDLCNAGCSLLAIDPEGLVHACPITCGEAGFVAGDLREQSLEDIWRTSPSLNLLRAAHARDREACRDCPVVDACGGECWVQAHYAASTADQRAGYLAPFPYCGLVRPVLERLGAASPRPATDPPAAGVDLTPFDCI